MVNPTSGPLYDFAEMLGDDTHARQSVIALVGNVTVHRPASVRLMGLGDLRGRPVTLIHVDEVDAYPDGPSIPGDPIAWQRGDVRGNLAGAYARPGWASRCLEPAAGLWETFRLSRRAARRQRRRARAARRQAQRAAALGRRLADRLALSPEFA